MSESHIQNRPVICVAVSPRSTHDWETFQRALNVLAQQDSSIGITTKPAEGRAIISGTSELHLETICDRISREWKIQLDVGEPNVIYLETIRKYADAEAKYIRQVGGHGQYAHVKVRVEPGSGYQFIDESSEDALPRRFVESIDLGIQTGMKTGVLAGHEMVDVRAVLYDGSYHVEDSNEMAFKIAASVAFKEAARKASPLILEPLMSIEVVAPEAFAGAIMGDLNSRRGRIESMEHRVGSFVIHAVAPLAELLGYAMQLRAMTQGQNSSYSMHFARYEASRRGGESGIGEIGVTANKPRGPKPKSGFAAAERDEPE